MPPRISRTGNVDPDSDAKDSREEELAAWWGEQLQLQEQELWDELDQQAQDPGGDWWKGWAAIFLAFMVPQYQGMVEQSAEGHYDRLGVGPEWDAILAQSSNWASTYGFNMVTTLNGKSRAALQDALTEYLSNPDLGLEYVQGKIASYFGPTRAANIAITETTRGFENGKRIYADQLAQIGVQTEPRWYTVGDEKVCQICEPNHGKLRSEGWTASEIPAHPRDRCWTEIETV